MYTNPKSCSQQASFVSSLFSLVRNHEQETYPGACPEGLSGALRPLRNKKLMHIKLHVITEQEPMEMSSGVCTPCGFHVSIISQADFELPFSTSSSSVDKIWWNSYLPATFGSMRNRKNFRLLIISGVAIVTCNNQFARQNAHRFSFEVFTNATKHRKN